MSMGIARATTGKIKKFEDVEIHVSEVQSQGQVFAEIREFIPSLGQYGKGITFPVALLNEVLNAAEKIPGSNG